MTWKYDVLRTFFWFVALFAALWIATTALLLVQQGADDRRFDQNENHYLPVLVAAGHLLEEIGKIERILRDAEPKPSPERLADLDGRLYVVNRYLADIVRTERRYKSTKLGALRRMVASHEQLRTALQRFKRGGLEPRAVEATIEGFRIRAEQYRNLRDNQLRELRQKARASSTAQRNTAFAFLFAVIVIGAFATFRAVGQIKNIIERNRAARREKAAMEARIGDLQRMESLARLTGGVAHEFNNLLAVALGNIELAEETLSKPGSIDRKKVLALLGAAERGVGRGADLTGQLLAYSRNQPLHPQAVDLGEAVAEIENMMRASLGGESQLVTDHADDTWPAFADPGRLADSLMNLCFNARDAMPEGGEITIRSANLTLGATTEVGGVMLPAGDYVTLAISDTGTGMSEAVRRNAFEPFYTTKEIGQGTGLGLSMVHGFATQSEGAVTVDSELGRGTTIMLYLRRAADAATAAATAPTPMPDLGPNSVAVLIVDDDADVRTTLVRLVENLGCSVTEAADAQSALDMLAAGETPDIMFTDIVMPGGINGYDLWQQARRLQPDLRVVFTSGYAQDAMLQIGELGDHPFLNKPYGRREIADAIEATMAAAAPGE